MKLCLTSIEGTKIWHHITNSSFLPRLPFDKTPFSLIVWDHGDHRYLAEQYLRTLIREGCRYVIAGGNHVDEWEFVADRVFLSEFPRWEDNDESFVTTVALHGEALSEVMFYALRSAHTYDSKNFEHCLFIDIGQMPFSEEQIIEAYKQQP